MKCYNELLEEHEDISLIEYLTDFVLDEDECFTRGDLWLFTRGYYVSCFGGSFNDDDFNEVFLKESDKIIQIPDIKSLHKYNAFGPQRIEYFKIVKPMTQKELYQWLDLHDCFTNNDTWCILEEVDK